MVYLCSIISLVGRVSGVLCSIISLVGGVSGLKVSHRTCCKEEPWYNGTDDGEECVYTYMYTCIYTYTTSYTGNPLRKSDFKPHKHKNINNIYKTNKIK